MHQCTEVGVEWISANVLQRARVHWREPVLFNKNKPGYTAQSLKVQPPPPPCPPPKRKKERNLVYFKIRLPPAARPSNKKMSTLETTLNIHFEAVYRRILPNKLSLNIGKTNFVVFHPPQTRICYQMELSIWYYFISVVSIKQESSIKYLGINIDCNLTWKSHILHVPKKVLVFYETTL